MKTLAITGGTGFIGRRLMAYNAGRYRLLRLSLRDDKPSLAELHHVDTIIHLAGMAHQMQPVADGNYFAINYDLTRELADHAVAQGVNHFIYVSSTKVYGDEITGVLDEQSPCHPTDAYGASKLQAEQYLQSISSPGFTVSIVRPPLVYGPGVKGNMVRMLEMADKRIPLPFGKITNARSMVYVDNLIELLNVIIDLKAGGIFIAGDIEPISTSKMIALIREALGSRYPLFSIPRPLRVLLKEVAPHLYVRLFGSFVVSTACTNKQLHFVPPYKTEEGIKAMANWFLNKK